jgi:peptidoglycan-associated lipoprotein
MLHERSRKNENLRCSPFNITTGEQFMKKIATVIASSLLIAACSSTQNTGSNETSPNAVASNNAQTTAAAYKNAQTATQSQASADSRNPSSQQDAFNNDSIYFDFDRYDVKPAFREAAQREAEWIRAHKNDKVTLEGNTDDRGSIEYNLALGDRRARAVHQMLTALGVPSSRVKDVSLGEEKPRASCEEEKCWQENRRVDFVHKLNQSKNGSCPLEISCKPSRQLTLAASP